MTSAGASEVVAAMLASLPAAGYVPWTLPLVRDASRGPVDTASVPKLHAEIVRVEYLQDGGAACDGDHGPPATSVAPETPISMQNPLTVELIGTETLTSPEAEKTVRSLTLACSDPSCSLEAGDAFGLLCENDPIAVEAFLGLLGWAPETLVKVHPLVPLPASDSLLALVSGRAISVWDIFLRHADVMHFPKKSLLRHLAEFCSDERDRQDLLFLSCRAGSEDYMRLAAGHASLIDFLHSFPTCRPPLATLLGHLPPLHPRYYSVCNTLATSKGPRLEFTYSSMQYTLADTAGTRRQGVCTSWLDRCVRRWHEHAESGKKIWLQIFPRPGHSFRLPPDRRVPLVMVCAGTGVSPFIGFLRSIRRTEGPRPLTWLMFGIRKRAHDFLFESELEEMQEDGTLSRLSLATSQEPDSGHPRYVQDALARDSHDLFSLMAASPAAVVYICGEQLKMVKGVTDALQDMIAEHGGLSAGDAQAELRAWQAAGRVVRDVWV